jgi:hypothetical protein
MFIIHTCDVSRGQWTVTCHTSSTPGSGSLQTSLKWYGVTPAVSEITRGLLRDGHNWETEGHLVTRIRNATPQVAIDQINPGDRTLWEHFRCRFLSEGANSITMLPLRGPLGYHRRMIPLPLYGIQVFEIDPDPLRLWLAVRLPECLLIIDPTGRYFKDMDERSPEYRWAERQISDLHPDLVSEDIVYGTLNVYHADIERRHNPAIWACWFTCALRQRLTTEQLALAGVETGQVWQHLRRQAINNEPLSACTGPHRPVDLRFSKSVLEETLWDLPRESEASHRAMRCQIDAFAVYPQAQPDKELWPTPW